MELIDMGRKEETPTTVGEDKSRISYPSFSIQGDKIPEELKTAPVGGLCRLEIVVKKIGDSIDTYDKQEPRVEVEIRKLGYIGKAGKLSKEEYLGKSEEERAEYDKENMEKEPEKEEAKEEEKE